MISRRRFLALLGAIPLASTVVGPRVPPAVRTTPAAATQLWASELQFEASDLADLLRPLSTVAKPTWLSPPLVAPRPFHAVSPLWLPRDALGSPLHIAVRTSADGSAWGPWLSTDAEIAADMTPRGLHAGRLFFTLDGELARYVQVRVQGQPLQRLVLALHGGRGGPSTDEAARQAEPSLHPMTLAVPSTPRPPIITRTAWGCPDGQQSPRWQPQYVAPTHIVVHHTATSNAATDWAQQVRIVWDYHARTLGWGDIGYHYLIDPRGNIYEGRAGGENVVGGHTYGFNRGTVGIALLGTFLDTLPTLAAREALAQLCAYTCSRRSINPRTTALITAQHACGPTEVTKPTLGGHRDFAGHSCTPTDPNGTSCPGDRLYAELDNLRLRTASIQRGLFITQATFTTTKLSNGLRLDVTVEVWNNTSTIVRSDSNPPPGFLYTEGQAFTSKPATGFIRIGLDYAARQQPPQYPYRWGLGGDLQPGEKRTITGTVLLRSQRATDYWLTLIQEWVGFAEEFHRTRVVYDLTPPTAKVDPLPERVAGQVRVSWSGSDAVSEVVSYDVEVREVPDGAWTTWLQETRATSAFYKGKSGKRYEFRVRARDEAGNVSAYAMPPAGANQVLVVSELHRLALPTVRR